MADKGGEVTALAAPAVAVPPRKKKAKGPAKYGSHATALLNPPGDNPAQHTSRKTLSAIEKDLGGRSQLIEALEFAGELSEKEMKLLNLLATPQYKDYTLPTLCKRAGVSISQLLKMFQKSMAARTYIQVMERVYGHAVPVVEDVMARSLVHHVICPACHGEGDRPDGKPCPECRGKKVILSDPDWDRQKSVLNMTGALQTGQNIQINNNQQVNKVDMTVLRSTIQFRAATDRLLYPGRERRTSEEKEEELPIDVESRAVEEEGSAGAQERSAETGEDPGLAQPEPGGGNPEAA